jgi:hypothetical protein
VKYIFIGKQKVVLCPKLKKNQKEAAANALSKIVLRTPTIFIYFLI